jgi:hypothetical protein
MNKLERKLYDPYWYKITSLRFLNYFILRFCRKKILFKTLSRKSYFPDNSAPGSSGIALTWDSSWDLRLILNITYLHFLPQEFLLGLDQWSHPGCSSLSSQDSVLRNFSSIFNFFSCQRSQICYWHLRILPSLSVLCCCLSPGCLSCFICF